MTIVLKRRGYSYTETYKGKTTRRHREKMTIHPPEKEASEGKNPKGTLILNF